jgi:hypothetical protein
MEKPVKLILTDLGSRGQLTVHGEHLGVRSVQILVSAADETLVMLTIPARYCDITYDADWDLHVDDNH